MTVGWTAAQQREWAAWVATRPPSVQALCRQFPCDRKYWLDPPGQVVSIHSYGENSTVTVLVEPEDNPLMLGGARRVFGIPADHLHALPAEGVRP